MIRIDGPRLLRDLHRLRRFGAVNYDERSFGGDGIAKGVSRVSLSREGVEARKWFAGRCAEAGLSTSIDPLGTTLASRLGKRKRLLCGSHSDSQPEGGWLDGALGCVFALEASRALQEATGIDPEACGIAVVNLAEEAGRFGT